MPRLPKYTDEQIARIQEKWRNRPTHKSIARDEGLEERDIEYILYVLKPRKRKPLSEAQLDQLAEDICKSTYVSRESNEGEFHADGY